jgi:brefeldin A-resistance guanine nucleotide exchange factor 1
MICNSPVFDKELFRSMWKPVTSAIAVALMTFDDNYIIERATAGFRQCATLAGHFQLPEVVDYMVVSLSQATGLLSDNLPPEVPVYLVVEVEGRSITVSSLAVNFGARVKGQHAFGVLFDIVRCNGNAIREGWSQVRCFVPPTLPGARCFCSQVFGILLNLFIHSLLPARMLQMEDLLGSVSLITLRGSRSQLRRPAPTSDDFLSTLSSYLMTPYSSAEDRHVPSASDIENTLRALDCVSTCQLEELCEQIMYALLWPLSVHC